MSELQTYAKDGEDLFILGEGDDVFHPSLEPSKPGQLVGHTMHPTTTIGTIVAVDETDISVLWSKAPPQFYQNTFSSGSIHGFPNYVYAPHVPLVVTPSIFANATGSVMHVVKQRVNQLRHDWWNAFSSGSI